jgi:serine/threonine protein phosphatase PrpC
MSVEIVQESHQAGRQRNEDRAGHWSTGAAVLMAVADGMGGHPHGDRAAETALQTLSELFLRQANPELPLPGGFLDRAFREAHRRLHEEAAEWQLEENHRTTLVACLVQKGLLWWAHSGDSRLYLARGAELVLRTRDHSFAELNEALQHGDTSDEDVPANILFSCLGSTSRPLIDRGGPWSLAAGDRVLLCSDGLWGPLSDLSVLQGMVQGSMEQAVPALVQRALAAGGAHGDNVTALGCTYLPA